MKLRTILYMLLAVLTVSAAERAVPVRPSEPAAPAASAPAAPAAPAAVTEKEEEATSESQPAADPAFERYKTITDRMPFGPEPSGFNPDAPPGSAPKGGAGGADGAGGMDEQQRSEEEQKILSAVRVSVLNVTPSGKIAVGFTDSSRQPAANYYLKVGESRDGWTVKEADARAMTVVLSNKEGVEATLKLGETAGGDAKGGKKGAMAGPMGMKRPGFLARQQSNANGAAAPGAALANLRARRQQREANAAEEKARQDAAAAEEKKAREQAAADREQQREALLQIQEELRQQREAREQRQQQEQQQEQAPQE